MPVSKVENRKKKLADSILDAALDELDSGSDDEEDEDQNINQATKTATNGASLANCADVNAQSNNEQSTVNKNVMTIDENQGKSKNANQRDSSKSQKAENLEEEDDDLAESLENMMKQFLTSSGQGGINGTNEEMEEMFRQLNNHSIPSTENQARQQTSTSTQGADSKSAPTEVDRTIDKLLSDMSKAGAEGDMGTEAAQLEGMGEDIMESMMKEFEKMGQTEDSDNVIDGMMKQLLSKDIMYGPMKQVSERFPRWLAESKSSLSEEEYNRYGQQYQYFQRIVAVYETDPDNFPRLMELMQDIQEFGQPPADIIKDLAPDLELDDEGMPKMQGMPGMPFPGNEQCSIM